MVWLVVLVVVAAVAVVAIGLAVVGRETARLTRQARPAVFELEEAVGFIADQLPDDVAGRLTPDDVRWIVRIDATSLEEASTEPERVELGPEVLDEDAALARVLAAVDQEDRELADADVAAVIAARTAYLEAIGAIGPRAAGPADPDSGGEAHG